jgi:single-stranded-DNA-specific exonuclease
MPLREALLEAAVVVPHTDADGLAAGAMALRARGEGADAALLFGRGENPWRGPLPDGVPALLDWGVRELGRTAVVVDHHAPEVPLGEAAPSGDAALRAGTGLVVPAVGPDAYVLTGHGEDPEVSTAALMRRVLPDQPAWLAAVGAVGDLGDAAFALPECEGAPKTAVRKLVPLVNAPRRGPGLDGVRVALALLVEHDSPKAALADPRLAVLEAARDEWRAEWERVRKTAPKVGQDVAVIRFDSSFQLHPLAAQMWSRRLAPRPVLAANDGYLPGRVAFSIRGGEGDLRALLKRALPDVGGEFAHGHPRATGGTLSPEDFERLLAGLA